MESIQSTAAIGIDVGGTGAKWALVSSSGTILLRGSFATGAACSKERLISEICGCIRQALQWSESVHVKRITICLPGVVDADGIVRVGAPNLPCICNLDFAEALSAFGIPIAVYNDAKAAAIGEAAMGAARGQKDFLFFIYGTGIGGALVLDRNIRAGNSGFAGEVGYCDGEKDSVAEQTLSTIALMKAASALVGKKLDGKAFFDRLAHDPVLQILYRSWIDGNARLIANALLVVDVPLVVIGGGISAQGDRLTGPLQESVRERLPEGMKNVQIVPARLGNDAALFSAIA